MLNRNLMRLSVLLSVVTMSAWSCEKSDSNGPRKEYIEVYLSKDAEEPVTSLSVPCAGGEFRGQGENPVFRITKKYVPLNR